MSKRFGQNPGPNSRQQCFSPAWAQQLLVAGGSSSHASSEAAPWLQIDSCAFRSVLSCVLAGIGFYSQAASGGQKIEWFCTCSLRAQAVLRRQRGWIASSQPSAPNPPAPTLAPAPSCPKPKPRPRPNPNLREPSSAQPARRQKKAKNQPSPGFQPSPSPHSPAQPSPGSRTSPNPSQPDPSPADSQNQTMKAKKQTFRSKRFAQISLKTFRSKRFGQNVSVKTPDPNPIQFL